MTAAWTGLADMAMSNAIGGIAAQTAFLSIADFFNRRANLEHAAASVPNIMHGTVLLGLLGLILLAGHLPAWTISGIHPVSVLLVFSYLGGLSLARASRESPQWYAKQTRQTRQDVPDPPRRGETLKGLWLKFAAAAAVTAVSGWYVAQSGIMLIERTGLSGSIVGGVFTALATSTPELVTAVAAVRSGALTLAVGAVLGGNAFDVLFAAAADVAYRDGSIYHEIGEPEQMLTTLSIVMAAVLLTGLVHRERQGIANIGFESVIVLLLYVGGIAILTLGLV